MATFDEIPVVEQPVVTPTEAKSTVLPGTVRIENKLPIELDITLNDGSNLSVGIKQRSRALARKLLPPYLNKMAAKGDIKILAIT